MAKYDDNEYEVVWEPIDDNSEIMNIPLEQIGMYYNGIISKYKKMIGKTDQEIKLDFEGLNPRLYKFTDYCASGSISDYFALDHKSTVRDCIAFLKNLNDLASELLKKLSLFK